MNSSSYASPNTPSESGLSSAVPSRPASPGGSKNGEQSNRPTTCTNCFTQHTPLWHRNPEGQPLCNACGLYLKRSGRVRQLSLRTDVIKKRNCSSANSLAVGVSRSAMSSRKNSVQQVPLSTSSLSLAQNGTVFELPPAMSSSSAAAKNAGSWINPGVITWSSMKGHPPPSPLQIYTRPEWSHSYGQHQHSLFGPYSTYATNATNAPNATTVYSFVPIPGAQQHKRPHRRYEEIERMYNCGWNGCEKAYATLNHLNAHVTMQSHGAKRTPEEFKEIRKEWKARKKEEESQCKAAEEREHAAAAQAEKEHRPITLDKGCRDAFVKFFVDFLREKSGIEQDLSFTDFAFSDGGGWDLWPALLEIYVKEVKCSLEKKTLRSVRGMSYKESVLVEELVRAIDQSQHEIMLFLACQRPISSLPRRELAKKLLDWLKLEGQAQQVRPENIDFVLWSLITSAEFEQLGERIRRTLYGVDESKAIKIQDRILGLLQDHAQKEDETNIIYFKLESKIADFLKDQYDEVLPRLSSVLVLTGSAFYAEATTCYDYMTRTWPKTGKFVLSLLQRFFDRINIINKEGSQDTKAFVYDEELNLPLSLKIECTGALNIIVVAEASPEVLVEIGQQIAWLGATLSASPFGNDVVHAEAQMKSSLGGPSVTFKIEFQPLTESQPEEARPCWLPLFEGATIARGFPIMERGMERGLEVSVEAITLLIGAQHAVEYKDSVIIKGFSTLLAPIERVDDRVQWHLVSNVDPEEHLSYHEGLNMCPTRVSLQKFGLQDLTKTRAIIGWCSTAKCLLGSSEANYHNIDYSKAADISRSLNITGGTLGIQQIGVAQVDVALERREGKYHLQRSGPYRRILALAEKTYVALYDTTERRGWLVPASGVLLHIAHHRHHLDPFNVDGKGVELCAVSEGGPSVKDALLQNEIKKLMDDEPYIFRDMIFNIWSIIEYLIAQQVELAQSPGLRPQALASQVIYGFEFKAVTEERSPFRVKQESVLNTSSRWPSLVRDIDALVLFASGYEDILQPSSDDVQGLCRQWRTVSKGKDYLATTIRTLKDIYDAAGSRLDRTYLTSTHLQWHRGSSLLWEPCQKPLSHRCDCKRLQHIVAKWPGFKITPPGQLADDGAIIIGGQNLLQKRPKLSKRSKNLESIYSQPNITLGSIPLQYQNDSIRSFGRHTYDQKASDSEGDDHNSDGNSPSDPSWQSFSTTINDDQPSSDTSQELLCPNKAIHVRLSGNENSPLQSRTEKTHLRFEDCQTDDRKLKRVKYCV